MNMGAWIFTLLKRAPGSPVALSLLAKLRRLLFRSSAAYWETRYAHGGTSGAGSRGTFAQFKADVLNRFVRQHNIHSVIDFGCGDGDQLALACYPLYIGFDVSREATKRCAKRFSGDSSKSFFVYDPQCFVYTHSQLRAELALSLDVIYHLVEDDVFELYLRHLFSAGERYVIIFSSDSDSNPPFLAPHVKHRCFTRRVAEIMPQWQLVERISNELAYQSYELPELAAHFFVYERRATPGALSHQMSL